MKNRPPSPVSKEERTFKKVNRIRKLKGSKVPTTSSDLPAQCLLYTLGQYVKLVMSYHKSERKWIFKSSYPQVAADKGCGTDNKS